jgi:glycosidase
VLELGSHRGGQQPGEAAAPWWRSAAIYQLYVRSFADGNGDGVGDLAGVRAHLGYLAGLGIDAIWFNPWYPSPMSDAGYDIADYRDIDPVFGTLADADALIAGAHAQGIRIITDIVPNHASDQHPWFRAAVAAPPGSAERARFWFRAGRGPGGDLPPYSDRDDVHEIYRSWRALADEYGDRVLIGEIWIPDAARLARYVSPGELHTVFNFPYLSCPWDAAQLRQVIDNTLALHAPVGAPATWVLSNHDVDRIVSRLGRPDTGFSLQRRPYFHSLPADLGLGARRARAAALLTMALPGAVYVYQGEELGLWEVQDIPDGRRQDPIWHRASTTDPGRDGSRVPLPWAGAGPPFGFSPAGASGEPWLPQPAAWRDLTVQAETGDPGSMLELYRTALRIRRAEPALGDGTLTWLPSAAGVLAFERGSSVRCVINLSAEPARLPEHSGVLLATGPLDGGLLPPDGAVWLRSRPPAAEVPGAAPGTAARAGAQ